MGLFDSLVDKEKRLLGKIAKGIDRGLRFMERGDKEGARGVFLDILKLYEQYHPPSRYHEDFSHALDAIGYYLWRLGDADSAIFAINKALEIYPENSTALMNMGEICYARKEFEKAEKFFRDAVRIEPTSKRALGGLADSLYKLKKYDDALEVYMKILDVDPHDFKYYDRVLSIKSTKEIYSRYASALADVHRVDDAISMLEKALESWPDDGDLWQQLGELYEAIEHYHEAIECITKAVRYKKDDSLYVKLAQICIKDGDSKNALKYARKAANVLGTSEAHKVLGDAYALAGKHKDAVKAYEKAISMDENNIDALYGMLGSLEKIKGSEEKVLEVCDKILEKYPGEVNILMKKGEALEGLKRYEDALEVYYRILDIDPNNLPVIQKTTRILHSLQRFEEMRELADRWVSLAPDSAEALKMLGISLENVGDVEGAYSCYLNGIDVGDSKDLELLTLAKNAAKKLGKTLDVINLCDKILKIDPSQTQVWMEEGDAFYDIDNLEMAEKCYREVLARDEKNIDALWALENVYRKEDKLKDAEKTLKYLAKIEENDPEVWAELGDVLSLMGRYEEALKAYDKAISLKKGYAPYWYHRGLCCEALNRYEEALVSYSKAKDLDPSYMKAWFGMGYALENLERVEEAVECYRKCTELSPNDKMPYIRLAQAYVKLSQFEQALSAYDEALRIDPDDTAVLKKKCSILSKLERYEELLQCADAVVEKNDEDPEGWKYKALALKELEKTDEAIESLKKVVSMVDDIECLKDLVNLLMESERYEEALSYANNIIDLAPNNIDGWIAKATCLDNLARVEEAKSAYEKCLELDRNNKSLLVRYASILDTLGMWD
ncbi:MAG: hypothetical protein DRN20_03865, partial [Thermoplasmata archaeon]